MSWSAIEQIESGRRRNPRPDTLSALARTLGVTIDYLVQGGARPPTMLKHQALIYGSDDDFVATAAPFLAEGIERSDGLLAVTTEENVELLQGRLGVSADQVEFVEAQSWYSDPVSAMNAYEAFVDEKTESGASWVRIIGEPVWAGRSNEEVRLWNQYESILNFAMSPMPVTVLCPYDQRSVDAEVIGTARLTHPEVVALGEVRTSPLYREPGDFVLGT
jgi:transcriptional regulator with XRE-family HTH domain